LIGKPGRYRPAGDTTGETRSTDAMMAFYNRLTPAEVKQGSASIDMNDGLLRHD
jgi:hypothetical protein